MYVKRVRLAQSALTEAARAKTAVLVCTDWKRKKMHVLCAKWAPSQLRRVPPSALTVLLVSIASRCPHPPAKIAALVGSLLLVPKSVTSVLLANSVALRLLVVPLALEVNSQGPIPALAASVWLVRSGRMRPRLVGSVQLVTKVRLVWPPVPHARVEASVPFQVRPTAAAAMPASTPVNLVLPTAFPARLVLSALKERWNARPALPDARVGWRLARSNVQIAQRASSVPKKPLLPALFVLEGQKAKQALSRALTARQVRILVGVRLSARFVLRVNLQLKAKETAPAPSARLAPSAPPTPRVVQNVHMDSIVTQIQAPAMPVTVLAPAARDKIQPAAPAARTISG